PDRRPGEPAVMPPRLYCTRRRAFFTAPCPTCGAPLTDVRDDRLLESLALPRRDRSLVRFLACRVCGPARLWTLFREPDMAPSAPVGDAQDLFRAFAPLAHRAGTALPCQGCEHVPTCYPEAGAGEAQRLLTPVTFYESRAIALPFAHLRWDEAMQVAGVAAPGVVAERATTEPGRARELGRLAPRLAAQPAPLFAHDVAGKLGLEVLRVKLALFAQLCRTTAALHRYTRAPHLGLTPTRVLVTIDPDTSGLPWLWRLGVRLAGLGNARARGVPD